MRTPPIFIIGYGRSGTHWLARTLAVHPDIRATIEVQPIFSMVTEMALNPILQDRLFWRLVLRYKWQILISRKRRYLDKSHPNIWMAEKLVNAFPDAQFLGIERDPYAAVASAIKHRGGESIRNRWREMPIPNNFLGIDNNLVDSYDGLPLSKKYALSWASHHKRMTDLKNTFTGALKVIKYEDLVVDTANVLSYLQHFLNLALPIPMPEVKSKTLSKWESQLSKDQVKEIQSIVGFSPSQFQNV